MGGNIFYHAFGKLASGAISGTALALLGALALVAVVAGVTVTAVRARR